MSLYEFGDSNGSVSLCGHDLSIYAESLGGKMFHYRDGRRRELDAVVEMPGGRWHAFEMKLGFGQVEAAAKHLLKMKAFFGDEGVEPSSLTVICGMTEYAYTRPDGVNVVPITSLKP